MPAFETTERQLTELDFARLRKLVVATLHPDLADVLMSADVLPSRTIDPDIVTMYSQVVIEDLATGQQQTLVICYPHDADPSEGYISALSPAAVGLLGLRVGATASWRTPGGEHVDARIVAILFQPEATGDYVT